MFDGQQDNHFTIKKSFASEIHWGYNLKFKWVYCMQTLTYW